MTTDQGSTMPSSWRREAQRLAVAGDVDRGEAGRDKAAARAIALLGGFELAFAGAELCLPAPVQRPVLDLDGAVVGIDGRGEAVDLLRLPRDIGVKAFAGGDAIPATAGHAPAVVG